MAAGVCLAFLLVSARADACSLPVFRYALERWPADPYHVFVYHRGALGDRDRTLVEGVRRLAEESPFANLTLKTVDLEAAPDPLAAKDAPPRRMESLPWMIVLYPGVPGRVPEVWSGPLTPENVEAALDSPARREIVRRIQAGESAVWILLECGDAARDDRAARILGETLEKMEKELAIPEQDAEALGIISDGGPEMKIAFSMLRLSRSDPRERFLIETLLGSEPDLAELEGPMAFPVFGRGRLLYALVGDGISAENVAEACFFLTGPCLCEVKSQHPGIEILIAFDWDGFLRGEASSDHPVRIPGMAQFDAGTGAFRRPRQAARAGSPVYRGLAWGLGGIFVLVAAGALLLARRGKG